MSIEQASGSPFVVRCRKCSEQHRPGVFRCRKCNTSLRPIFLGIVTAVGPVLLVLISLLMLPQLDRNPLAIVSIALNVVGIVVLLQLRSGRYWAWWAVQILWAINLGVALLLGIFVDPSALARGCIQAVVIAALFFYMRTDAVRAFCSVGRKAA